MVKDIKLLYYELSRVFDDPFFFRERIKTSFDELCADLEYDQYERFGKYKTAIKKPKIDGGTSYYCIEDHVIEYLETLVAQITYLFPTKKKELGSLLIELSEKEHLTLLKNLDDDCFEDLEQSLNKIKSYLKERASGLDTDPGKNKGPISFGINHDYIKKLDKIEVIVTKLAREEVFINAEDVKNFMKLIQLKKIVENSPKVRLSGNVKDFRHVWMNFFQNRILINSTFKDIEDSGKFFRKDKDELLTANALTQARNKKLSKPGKIEDIIDKWVEPEPKPTISKA